MSKAHALAKLPDAIEWLLAALGAPQTRGSKLRVVSNSRRGKGVSTGQQDSDGAVNPVRVPEEESAAKFLVFAHHVDVMDRLAAALGGYEAADGGDAAAAGDEEHPPWPGVEYVRIDGSHDMLARREAVRNFRDRPSVRVALLSVTAAAVGLDFSSASNVVFAELPDEVRGGLKWVLGSNCLREKNYFCVFFLAELYSVPLFRWRWSVRLRTEHTARDKQRPSTSTSFAQGTRGTTVDGSGSA